MRRGGGLLRTLKSTRGFSCLPPPALLGFSLVMCNTKPSESVEPLLGESGEQNTRRSSCEVQVGGAAAQASIFHHHHHASLRTREQNIFFFKVGNFHQLWPIFVLPDQSDACAHSQRRWRVMMGGGAPLCEASLLGGGDGEGLRCRLKTRNECYATHLLDQDREHQQCNTWPAGERCEIKAPCVLATLAAACANMDVCVCVYVYVYIRYLALCSNTCYHRRGYS